MQLNFEFGAILLRLRTTIRALRRKGGRVDSAASLQVQPLFFASGARSVVPGRAEASERSLSDGHAAQTSLNVPEGENPMLRFGGYLFQWVCQCRLTVLLWFLYKYLVLFLYILLSVC